MLSGLFTNCKLAAVYAITDIETTGGNARHHNIIEIGICKHDGEKVVDRFHTHVNPEQSIPAFITRLTGINDSMVENAPTFAEIADELYEFLSDTVFVAHNVGFDYGFIKRHFEEEDIRFQKNRLCTVRLSRKLIPGLPSYSLGNLCKSLEIPIKGRHTALGDAEATAVLFNKLCRIDRKGFIQQAMKRNSGESLMPPHLDREKFDQLPDAMGIYYLLDKKKQPIYIGKSKNIKKRIHGHFSSGSTTRERLRFVNEIYDIHTRPCPNELIMDLTECHEIKRYWPRYNREYKKRSKSYGVYSYEDGSGAIRYHINKVLHSSKPLVVFPDYVSAYNFMKAQMLEFDLCPKKSGLQQNGDDCMHTKGRLCQNKCHLETNDDYAARSRSSYRQIQEGKDDLIIVAPGFEEGEYAIVLIEKGRYLGFGYTNEAPSIEDLNSLKETIEPYKPTMEIDHILQQHINSGNFELLTQAAVEH